MTFLEYLYQHGHISLEQLAILHWDYEAWMKLANAPRSNSVPPNIPVKSNPKQH
jgi:hypothetical protein